jgi:hypothetical protein
LCVAHVEHAKSSAAAKTNLSANERQSEKSASSR